MKLMNDETVKFILEYDILVSCNHTKQAGGSRCCNNFKIIKLV